MITPGALAVLVLRIGSGILFIFHGYPKVVGGVAKWQWLGSQMSNFGIHFAPVVWGCMAACTEFFGGIALVLGIGTRVAAFFIAIVMIVALVMHIKRRDGYAIYSHPLSNLIIMITLMVM
jgi:putative oxidoreductase